jgi:serine phosphatase RsbU (regulator of sigma subunit)/anti-sigma regulatory factor (Ser/Thr protein kinase)
MTQSKPYSFDTIAHTLSEKIHTKKEIMTYLHKGLIEAFNFSTITTILFDSNSDTIDATLSTGTPIAISLTERQWVFETIQKELKKSSNNQSNTIYLNERKSLKFIDSESQKENETQFDYECSDGIYFILYSEEKAILGLTYACNWDAHKTIGNKEDVHRIAKKAKSFIATISLAIDNLQIHEKIENLLSDKQELTRRIKQDEEDLKRRILELTALYDTSNALGYTLNYHQIATVVMDSLTNVLEFDVCSVFLWGFIPEGEILTRANTPLSENAIKQVHANIITAISPFLKHPVKQSEVKVILQKQYSHVGSQEKQETMKSFANVPLIFKEEVIGMLNICSNVQNAFPRNEMTFLHTMANQLSSNLGRLKIVKKLEESKISALIESMNEGVLMFDENNTLKVINPAGKAILDIKGNTEVKLEKLTEKFKQIGLLDIYNQVEKSKTPALDKQVSFNNSVYSVNITPANSAETGQIGNVIVFRDITELQKIDRIKTQRLNVISSVNEIISSISDLNNLLSVLMTFILDIAQAEMGSIQLKTDKVFFSKVHSNFPDKIRRFYKFTNGTKISDHTIQTKEIVYIDDYVNNKNVVQNTKILIDSYLCIPLIVKNELLGVVNIVRKYGNTAQKLAEDDITTLKTITSLCATAIQNAMLYQETLSKEKLDQELKVATDIQQKLLPETLPQCHKTEFGALSIPARQIGGDYYDFFELENGSIGVVIADIVGKGIPAGLFMATLKSILHTHMRGITAPKKAMEKINYVLVHDPVVSKFVPFFYAVYDPQTHTFTYCNAGHESPLFFSEGKFTTLDTEGFPLGAAEDTEYEERQIKLKDQDAVIMFTDGIVEARNNKDQSFGYVRLKRLIKDNIASSANEIAQEIYTTVKAFSTTEQHDDLTLVCLKRSDKSKDTQNEKPEKTIKLKISSAKKHVKEVRKKLDEICTKMGFSDADIFDIKLAINEAHANVIEHAYFGSEEGDILFKFEVFKDKLKVSIKDYGQGVGQKTIKGKEEDLKDLEGSGLGVHLINTIMDVVKFERHTSGTELKLEKHLKKGK